jgi:integrase/recombinase XerC
VAEHLSGGADVVDPTSPRCRRGRFPRGDPALDTPLARLASEYVTGRHRRGEIGAGTARQARFCLYRFTAAADGSAMPGHLDVSGWLDGLGQLAPRSRRWNVSIVRGFTVWLVDQGHLELDPLARPPRVRVPRAVPRALPGDQAAAIVAACPDTRARLIVTLMLWLGLRRGEVPALRVDDVDRHGGTLRVRGKGGHERLLPLPPAVTAALDAYLAEHPPPGPRAPLVRSYQHPGGGITPARIYQIVSGAMTAAGVHLAPRDGRTPHALRHTAATDTLRAGATLADVQALLGHSSIATTAVYLKADTAALARALGNRRYEHERDRDLTGADGLL